MHRRRRRAGRVTHPGRVGRPAARGRLPGTERCTAPTATPDRRRDRHSTAHTADASGRRRRRRRVASAESGQRGGRGKRRRQQLGAARPVGGAEPAPDTATIRPGQTRGGLLLAAPPARLRHAASPERTQWTQREPCV